MKNVIYIDTKTSLEALFGMTELLIAQSCGDGDAVIICNQPRLMADSYDYFRKNSDYYPHRKPLGYNWTRERPQENEFLFYYGYNENLLITNGEPKDYIGKDKTYVNNFVPRNFDFIIIYKAP